jgi:SWI/SNF-related matrix-associated actin-dependent regulator 1 of chromatin subfamily A
VTSSVAGTALATQDALPESPLHDVKIATEMVRLSLASSSEHLVAIELDIAEARLREAAALQAQNRPIEAAAAVSAYGEHLASAAAHLELSGTAGESAAVDHFRAEVVKQQQGAGVRATGSTATGSALWIAGEVATAVRQDDHIGAQDIAVAAASAADKAATTIEKKAAAGVQTPGSSTAASSANSAQAPRTNAPASPEAAQAPAVPAAPGSAPAAGTTGAPATSAPAPSTSATVKSLGPSSQSDTATSDKAKAETVAKAARDAADRAKQAADRAKAAAKTTRDERGK